MLQHDLLLMCWSPHEAKTDITARNYYWSSSGTKNQGENRWGNGEL